MSDLDLMRRADLLDRLDFWFARYLQEGEEANDVAVAAALASRAAGDGHVFLDLRDYAGMRVEGEGFEIRFPALEDWSRSLGRSPHVGQPGEQTPLVWDERRSRLYLHRFWRYERSLADWILARVNRAGPELHPERLRAALDALFPAQDSDERQKLAAMTAVRRRFAVITGGPGTGKTTVAGKVLQLLAVVEARPLRVALTAPTGKAADRLAASIGAPSGPIAVESMTVHRLIGRLSRHGARPPDVVIMDEASMADLALLARLAAGLPEDCRLVLLGDKDQLSSVEAGAVLGDICSGPARPGSTAAAPAVDPASAAYSPSFCRDARAWAGIELSPSSAEVPTLRDAVAVLDHSYRFDERSGIGRLGRAVNSGAADAALEVLGDPGAAEASWRGEWSRDDLARRVVRGFGRYLQAESASQAFERFQRFCVLTPLRGGPLGVGRLNPWIERQLSRAGLVETGRLWYRGRPVLITRNDHTMRLYNGDVGIVWTDAQGEPRVLFREDDGLEGDLRAVAPTRLPEHETAFAMTVHKSQGSEFDEVLFLMPSKGTRILSRELLYTAVTRARKRIEIWGDEQVFREAVATTIHRSSGLADALWGGND
jgi:exodeoxyribonuclease V alpha subunit